MYSLHVLHNLTTARHGPSWITENGILLLLWVAEKNDGGNGETLVSSNERLNMQKQNPDRHWVRQIWLHSDGCLQTPRRYMSCKHVSAQPVTKYDWQIPDPTHQHLPFPSERNCQWKPVCCAWILWLFITERWWKSKGSIAEIVMVGDQIMMNEAETWCARMTNDYFQRTQFANTASGTQPCATREKILRLQNVRDSVCCFHTPSLTWESLLPVNDILIMF